MEGYWAGTSSVLPQRFPGYALEISVAANKSRCSAGMSAKKRRLDLLVMYTHLQVALYVVYLCLSSECQHLETDLERVPKFPCHALTVPEAAVAALREPAAVTDSPEVAIILERTTARGWVVTIVTSSPHPLRQVPWFSQIGGTLSFRTVRSKNQVWSEPPGLDSVALTLRPSVVATYL